MSGLPPPAPGCASCAARDAQVAEQAAQVQALQERIADLERAASRNSGNSSMPPGRMTCRGGRRRGSSGVRRSGLRGGSGTGASSPGRRGRRCAGKTRTGPRTITRKGHAGAAGTWPMRLTWALPGPISRTRFRQRRRSGSSTTCTKRGAPAGGSTSRPGRRACRTRPCPSGRGCAPWPFTWSSSTSRSGGAGT